MFDFCNTPLGMYVMNSDYIADRICEEIPYAVIRVQEESFSGEATFDDVLDVIAASHDLGDLSPDDYERVTNAIYDEIDKARWN